MEYTKKEFNNIMKAWDDNKSHSDIYHMINEWILKYCDNINSKEDINDILLRMTDGEELIEIVEDFVYGECYKNIRIEMGHNY
jgi:hypothetical protein